MKQQAIQYLALDVHQATTVGSVRDENGSVVMRATVPTEARAIVSWSRVRVLASTWPSRKGRRRSGFTICSSHTPKR
jgi:hypothetical protein